jgi:hypothetical protein
VPDGTRVTIGEIEPSEAGAVDQQRKRLIRGGARLNLHESAGTSVIGNEDFGVRVGLTCSRSASSFRRSRRRATGMTWYPLCANHSA